MFLPFISPSNRPGQRRHGAGAGNAGDAPRSCSSSSGPCLHTGRVSVTDSKQCGQTRPARVPAAVSQGPGISGPGAEQSGTRRRCCCSICSIPTTAEQNFRVRRISSWCWQVEHPGNITFTQHPKPDSWSRTPQENREQHRTRQFPEKQQH